MLLPLDLETTGLDPHQDRIIEVAWTIVHDDLTQHLLDFNSHVIEPSLATWHQLDQNDYVHNMHAASGLLDELTDISAGHATAYSVANVEQFILNDIEAGVSPDTPLILMGLSPQGVDRPFIHRWMPRLDKRLSYQQFDVSSLRMFFQPLGIDINVENDGAHRAKNDVIECLEMVRTAQRIVKNLQAWENPNAVKVCGQCSMIGHTTSEHEGYVRRHSSVPDGSYDSTNPAHPDHPLFPDGSWNKEEQRHVD